MKGQVVILSVSLLTACGTLNTTLSSDIQTSNKLRAIETRCQSIARVFSGASYDFCRLHAEPSSDAIAINNTPVIFFDTLVSGVLDTVLLPYAIY